ncbi:MAG: hypothetical protein ABIS50_11750 [Luteolibacter sp.]|uniref:hypothetical protein n=1 Tax=Luteolibacter sp. TaxID=1962973 RepID=UPI003266D7BD
MKTPTLVAGTVLIGIAIGFVVGNMAAGPGRSAQEDAAENSSRTKSSRWTGGGAAGRSTNKAESVASGFGNGREYVRMSASDALAIVKANLDPRVNGGLLDAARNNYEFQLMLSKLPLSEMESLMAISKEEGVPTYRIRVIFNAYASRDLDKAMAWADAQPDADSWKSVAISAAVARDPGRAMEMYQDALLGGRISSFGGDSMDGAYSLASNAAKQGKVALLQFLDSVPSSGAGGYMSSLLRNLPKEDMPGFLEELDKRVKDGKMEQWTMTTMLQTLASNDPALARSLIDKMPSGPERASREISFAGNLAQQGKTAEALELVKSALARQPGKEKEVFMDEAGKMYNSPNFITRMAEVLPPGVELTVGDVTNLANRSGRSDPVGMAKLLKSADDQSAYLENAIRNLGSRSTKPNETDFRVLEYRIQALGLTGSNAEAVQKQLAESRQKALGK